MPGGLDPHGPVAGEIAGLWWLMFWLGLAVFALFAAILVRALRARSQNDDAAGAPPRVDSDAVESRYVGRWVFGLGLVMTTAVLVVVLAFTVASMRAIPSTAGRDALRLDLVAHQWYWEVRYPAYGVTTRNTLWVPIGRQVELRLTSADVIHSWWVPALAGKVDAVPERMNTLVFQADRPGTYRGQCAEFCGLHHAKMRVAVVAMQERDFRAWLENAR